jgi:hypothetical protein
VAERLKRRILEGNYAYEERCKFSSNSTW